MAAILKNIIPRKLAESVQTTQYTAVGATALITKFTATNTGASDVSFSVNLVAVLDVPGNGNLVLKARTIAPNETYNCPELVGQVLQAGGYISTIAGAASVLTISASGQEIS
jgi:hypothetical protein